jgi:IS5 family transposase
VQRIAGDLAELAERAASHAEQLLTNARQALRRAQVKAESLASVGGKDAAAGRRRGRLRRDVNDLTEAARGDPSSGGADPAAGGRHHPGGGDPPGQPARRGRPPVAKGQLGKPVRSSSDPPAQVRR